jgi:hypothetical protein
VLLSFSLPLLTILCQGTPHNPAVALLCLLPALSLALHPGVQLLLSCLACLVLARQPSTAPSSPARLPATPVQADHYSAAFLAALNQRPGNRQQKQADETLTHEQDIIEEKTRGSEQNQSSSNSSLVSSSVRYED